MELSRGKLYIFRQYRLTLGQKPHIEPCSAALAYGALQGAIGQEVRPLESSPHSGAAENLEQPNVEC